MIKEFVPYEQALALKELGFKQDCFGYWNIDPYLPKPPLNLTKPFDHEWCLPAPLYQQTFRWFREKYNAVVIIQPQIVEYYAKILIDNKVVYSTIQTYEEAELECIKKLIKIIYK